MAHQRIKDFWINKINGLIITHNVQPDEADWQDQINNTKIWIDFETVGVRICKNIYAKANQSVPTDNDIKGDGYGRLCGDTFKDLGLEYEELVRVFQTKIGVDPTDSALAVDGAGNNILVDGNPIPKWKYDINQKIYNDSGKLTDIPAGMDLTDLLYNNDLFQKITDSVNGLPKLISRGLVAPNKPHKWGCNWSYAVNDAVLQNYKNAKTERDNYDNQIRKACGLNNTEAIPNNWDDTFKDVRLYFLNTLKIDDVGDLPPLPSGKNLNDLITFYNNPPACSTPCHISTHGDYTTRHTESEEFKRIKTKLNNKISDSELDNLLNKVSNCSHTDYDVIKQERDDLKTENTELKEHECDSKVAQKEKEIITKIITDLSLSTERERENLLEAVITEIKGKLTPPTGNSKELAAKQSKITELETEITKLKAGKPQNEVVEKITEFSKQLNLSENQISELKKADSYQALFAVQSKMVESKLNSEVQEKNHAQTLNYVLGAISLGSLLILAWVLINGTKNNLLGIKSKKEKD